MIDHTGGSLLLGLCDECFRAWSGTHEELRELAASAVGAVVVKTTTTQACVEEVQGCGIENPGQLYYLGVLAELRAIRKQVIGSVAGFTTAAYVELARADARASVQIVELTLSDPIVFCTRSGTCDLTAVDEVVQAVRTAVQAPLAVKLPGLPEATIRQAVDLLWRLLSRPAVRRLTSLPWVGYGTVRMCREH